MGLKDIGKGLLSAVWDDGSNVAPANVNLPATSNPTPVAANIYTTQGVTVSEVTVDLVKKKLVEEKLTPPDLKTFFANLSAMEAITAISREAKIQAAIISWSQATGKSAIVLKELFKTKLNSISTSALEMQQDSKDRKAALGTRENEIKVFEQKIAAELKDLEQMKLSVQAEYQKIDSTESAITNILNVISTETNQIINELGVK